MAAMRVTDALDIEEAEIEERFVRASPKPFALPKEVWINKPIESLNKSV